MRTEDVLARIDSALADSTAGPDAMRCRPTDTPPTVPARPVPLPSDVRAALARRVSDRHDLTPDNALQAVRDTEHGIPAKAEAQTLISEAMSRRRPSLRQVFASLAAALQHLRAASAAPADDEPGTARRDRPAWRSPYGPSQRRR